MKKFYFVLFFSLLSFSIFAQIYSFENNLVPGEFSASKGNLSIAGKGKLGTKSLQWNWTAGDVLTGTPSSMRTPSIQSAGGITLWIYNDTPINETFRMRFYEYDYSTTDRSCYLDVNLNFKGWRCVWARFRPDMDHAGYTLRCMKWEAPASGSGTLLVDYLEFVNSVSWERISDMHYTLKNTSDLVDFVATRNKTFTPPVNITTEEKNAVQTIRTRVDEWHLGNDQFTTNTYYKRRKNTFDNYVSRAVTASANLTLDRQADGTVNGKGLFPHDFYNEKIDGESVLTFRDISETYLIQLAFDAVKNNSESSKSRILDIFDWYYDQGWADGSGLGRLRFEMLRSAGYFHSTYLMQNYMTAEQSDRVMNAKKWYTLLGKVYSEPENPGETADMIRTLMIPKLMLALSIKDENEKIATLRRYKEYADNAFKKAHGYLGSIKPDYSGYHHRGPYYNAYYPDVLYIGSLVYYFLKGTPYELNSETYENLKNGLLAFRFMCADYETPAAITGRFPTQTGVLDKLLPAYAYLALAGNNDAELTAVFKRLWKPDEEPVKSYIAKARTEITFKTSLGEVEKMLELAQTNIAAEENPLGNKFMPYSGLLISRLSNHWVVRVKGFSKYIWDFEATTSENRYGRYLSYGHMELAKQGTNLRSYNPSHADWNWSLIPGTSAKYLTKTELDYQENQSLQRNFSDDPFLGGIAFDDETAVFANSMHDNTFDNKFYAKKSVFRFGNAFYCLGSGIKNENRNYFVRTTLFQNLKQTADDAVWINNEKQTQTKIELTAPVIKDNYGNAYIVEDDFVDVEFGTSFITGYINNGKKLTDGRYTYVMLIDATDEDITAHKNRSVIDILQSDPVAHIVHHKEKNILSASVFEGNTSINIRQLSQTNIPCILVLQEKSGVMNLAFSDPDMYRPSAAKSDDLKTPAVITPSEYSRVRIELNGNYEKISSEDNINVSQTGNGKTIVEFTKAIDGNTYRIRLKNTDVSSIPQIEQTNNIQISQSYLNTFQIATKNNEPYSLSVYDVWSRNIFAKNNLTAPVEISTNGFSSGIYFLHAKTAMDEVCVKMIR